jgi:SAM-dependent methyltransferase
VWGEPRSDFAVLDDRLIYMSLPETLKRFSSELVDVVGRLVKDGETVIEFGSGSGRNLLYLKKHFPKINFIGLELSPVSVDLSREAAKKFGVDVSFYVSNVCETLPDFPNKGKAALVYSAHALEMMPRIFPNAIHNMLATSAKSVIFYEPVEEYWSKDLRGLVSWLRVRYMDRLRGFMPALHQQMEQQRYVLVSAERFKTTINPINETVKVHIERMV